MKRLSFDTMLAASGLSLHDFISHTGAYMKDIQRARAEGLSVRVADNWSCRLDMHPVEIYGIDTWIEALSETV